MNNKFLKSALIAATLTVSNFASAALINLADFDASATAVDLNDSTEGSTTYTSDILTLSGGYMTNLIHPNLDGLSYSTITNPVPGIFRLDFSSFVSAIGMNVFYNSNDVSFRVFDENDVLLDSSLSQPTEYGPQSGFVGLSTGIANIAYALIDVPASSVHDLFIDNIIYQGNTTTQVSVPEPSTLAILGLGLAGFAARRAKKS